LQRESLGQLGVQADDLLAGIVGGKNVGHDLARELIAEIAVVGDRRLLENDSRQRLDSGKGVKREDLAETQRLLVLAAGGMRAFLGAKSNA
jgi:hypothetical protein